MIHCKMLNHNFETQNEMFKAMKYMESRLVFAKKSVIKFADSVPSENGVPVKMIGTKESEGAPKLEFGDTVYPVINTTLIMDSHEDVHLNGLWNKSIKDGVKPALILNHEYKIGMVISYPEDVVPSVKNIPWKDLNIDYEGETEALVFASKMSEDSNTVGFTAYRNRRKVQHSIRMEYVRIELAVNSDGREWANARKVFDQYINLIANKDEAIKNGYFWAVKEAKIHKEGSMVLEGSNSITPTLYEAGTYSTSQSEPEKSTQKRLDLLNQLITISK